MASPKVLINILLTSTRIVGKAFFEAGRQAVKNARAGPQGGVGADAAGVGHARSGSLTDQLTRQHRMTMDEAHLILNTKTDAKLDNVLQQYEYLFKANSPAPPPPKSNAAKSPQLRAHSHYIQSKVVRARERIEAELKGAETPPPAAPKHSEAPTQNPPGGGTS